MVVVVVGSCSMIRGELRGIKLKMAPCSLERRKEEGGNRDSNKSVNKKRLYLDKDAALIVLANLEVVSVLRQQVLFRGNRW